MNKRELTANQIYQALLDFDIKNKYGSIVFNLGDTTTKIKTTDIVGNALQAWFGEWLNINNIYANQPANTQSFPDFYLSQSQTTNLLEIKTFNFNATPAFDIANFESYCHSLRTNAYRLDADYLIFGYSMIDGIININKIWLKKIWEIAGSSKRYPLNTQIKRDVIYNIRPSSNFKFEKTLIFRNKQDFLFALHKTLSMYRGTDTANYWREQVIDNYQRYCCQTLVF